VLCRPLGVLLDNVAQGWTYNHVTWSDVATKDLASTTMVSVCVGVDEHGVIQATGRAIQERRAKT
jgi:hypothetical protein